LEKFCLCHFLGSYNGKSRLQHKFSKKVFLNNPTQQVIKTKRWHITKKKTTYFQKSKSWKPTSFNGL